MSWRFVLLLQFFVECDCVVCLARPMEGKGRLKCSVICRTDSSTTCVWFRESTIISFLDLKDATFILTRSHFLVCMDAFPFSLKVCYVFNVIDRFFC